MISAALGFGLLLTSPISRKREIREICSPALLSHFSLFLVMMRVRKLAED